MTCVTVISLTDSMSSPSAAEAAVKLRLSARHDSTVAFTRLAKPPGACPLSLGCRRTRVVTTTLPAAATDVISSCEAPTSLARLRSNLARLKSSSVAAMVVVQEMSVASVLPGGLGGEAGGMRGEGDGGGKGGGVLGRGESGHGGIGRSPVGAGKCGGGGDVGGGAGGGAGGRAGGSSGLCTTAQPLSKVTHTLSSSPKRCTSLDTPSQPLLIRQPASYASACVRVMATSACEWAVSCSS